MAQVPIVCLACEDTNPIAWKCFHCDFQFCDKCKTLHEREPLTRKHIVTAVRDLTSSKIIRNQKITNNLCKSHGEELSFYCCQCECFVCADCIGESHRKHELDKKENIIDEKEREIILMESDAKDSFHAEMDNIKTIRATVLNNVEEMKDGIKLRQAFLHKNIDDQANKVLSDLDAIKEDLLGKCDTNESKIDATVLEVDELVSSLKTHLGNQDIKSCRKECISLKQKLSQPLKRMEGISKMVLQGEENFIFGHIQHVQDVDKENTTVEICQVCKDTIKNKRTLHNCKHTFCRQCLKQQFKHRRACPTCEMAYDIINGTQPSGTIKIIRREGYYEINYAFNIRYGAFAGIYKFETYLPLTEKGQHVSQLLEVAFERKLMFKLMDNNNGIGVTSIELERVVSKSSQFNLRTSNGDPIMPSSEILDIILLFLSTQGVTEADI